MTAGNKRRLDMGSSSEPSAGVERTGHEAVLYTIGYQGATPESFVSALVEHGIRRLVDVRLRPYSRKRGFSGAALLETMRKAGIEYEHRPALGNPVPIQELYKSGRADEGRHQFRRMLENGGRGEVEELASVATAGVTAVMCLEKDPVMCHRSVVAELASECSSGALGVKHL